MHSDHQTKLGFSTAMSSAGQPKHQQSESIRIPLPSISAHTLLVLSPARNLATLSHTPIKPTASDSADVPTNASNPSPNPRHEKLRQTIHNVESRIAANRAQLTQSLERLRQQNTDLELEDDETALHNAQQVVSRHIRLLHQYNEIKDIGLGLLGLIADKEGKRLGDVMKEREISEKD